MIVYLLAVVAALVVAFGGVLHVGLPAFHSWQHGRCLARIAALERELGLAAPLQSLPSPSDVASRWQSGVNGWTATTPPYHPPSRQWTPSKRKGRGMWFGT